MIHKKLLVAIALTSVLFGCGEKDKNHNATDHSQPEDADNLTDAPIFNLAAETSEPKKMRFFDDPQPIFKFVAETKIFLNVDFRGPVRTGRPRNFSELQNWSLQDEVSYIADENTLVFKVRDKQVGLVEKQKAYRFENFYLAMKCESDLSNFGGQKATELLLKINKGEVEFCPDSTISTKRQQLEIVKYSGPNGIKVKDVYRAGEMTADEGYCSNKIIEENLYETTCGKFINRYVDFEENGKKETVQDIYFRSNGSGLQFGPNMDYHTKGTYEFILNNWVGFAEFDESGNHPELFIRDVRADKIYQEKL